MGLNLELELARMAEVAVLGRPNTEEPRGLKAEEAAEAEDEEELGVRELKPRRLEPEAPLNEVPPRDAEEEVGAITGRAEAPVGRWNLDLGGSLGVEAWAWSSEATLVLTVASVVTSVVDALPKVGRREPPPRAGKERLALGGALEARVAVTVGVISSVLLTITAALDWRLRGAKDGRLRLANGVMRGVNDLDT